MDFYERHDCFTMIGLALFPRLTLLFGNFISGGLLWWIGWIIAPNFLVAFMALRYWDSNPILVIVAWIFAFGGTSSESKAASKCTK